MHKNFNSLVITGWTGTGKTYFLTKLLESIVSDVKDTSKIIILNPKNEPFRTVIKSEKIISHIKTLDQIPAFTKVVRDYLLPRLINYLDNKETSNAPHIYIFIDEYLDFIYEKDGLGDDLLKFLLKYQKVLNITLFIATQKTRSLCYLTQYTKTHIALFYPEVYLDALTIKRGRYLDFNNILATGNDKKINLFLEELNDEINCDLTSFHLPSHLPAFKSFIAARQNIAPEKLREHYILLRISDEVPKTLAIKDLFELSRALKLTYVIKKTGRKRVPAYLKSTLHTHLHFRK